MELLIEAILTALKAAGLSAAAALPATAMPHLEGPVTAVGLKSLTAGHSGFYDYLGVETLEDGQIRELYGRRLDAVLSLDVYSPAKSGGAACREAAQAVLDALLGGVDGLSLGAFTVGQCAYDEDCCCFYCPCSAEAAAYVYTAVSEDGTEFTDFKLKGVLL